jgi:hypothetical protein
VPGEKLYRDLQQDMMKFYMETDEFYKKRCVGEVYINERNVPMFYSGYEHVEDKVREAFRVHAGAQV